MSIPTIDSLPKFTDKRLETAVSNLSERYIYIVKLSYFFGYSANSLAEMFPDYFGNANAVRRSLNRAYEQLKDLF